MPLGMEVGLGPGHIVQDGDPAPELLPKKGQSPQFSAHVYYGQTAGWIKCLLWPNGWMDQDATWYEGSHGPGNILFDATHLHPLQGAEPPIFGPCLMWPNGWTDQDSTWYEGRPRPRPHCVTWGSSFPP